MKKPTKKTSTSKRASAVEKRLGPKRAIVRWEPNPRRGVKTKIAVLECGHARALPDGPRKSYRCNQCRIEARDGSPVLSRYQKALVATGKSPLLLKKKPATAPAIKREPRAVAKTARRATAEIVVREPQAEVTARGRDGDVVKLSVQDAVAGIVQEREPEVERVAAYD